MKKLDDYAFKYLGCPHCKVPPKALCKLPDGTPLGIIHKSRLKPVERIFDVGRRVGRREVAR